MKASIGFNSIYFCVCICALFHGNVDREISARVSLISARVCVSFCVSLYVFVSLYLLVHRVSLYAGNPLRSKQLDIFSVPSSAHRHKSQSGREILIGLDLELY